MKLRNKKTGKIGWLYEHSLVQDIIIVYDVKGIVGKYTSLAELNEEWEDYEEPKEYWYIDYDGGILCGESDNSSAEKMMISMGNHFESLEEAEKAVEKLKAWKRLKDKGFKFNGWGLLKYGSCDRFDYSPRIGFSIPNLDKDEPYEYPEEIEKDLDLLFGGEE